MQRQHFFNENLLIVLKFSAWAVYFIADLFCHAVEGDFLIVSSFLCTFAVFLLTQFCVFITQQVKPFGPRLQAVVFIVSVISASIVWHKVWLIFHSHATTYTEVIARLSMFSDFTFSQWLTTAYYPVFLFVAWAGFYLGSRYFLANQHKELLLNEARLNTKHAQLEMLRYQLNPHFLFNVLNNIDVTVQSGNSATARNMIQNLSQFLRSSLDQGEQSKITIEEEIAIVKSFISIEKVRYDDALDVSLSLDEQCKRAMMPPMLLQPLVENAIKFAWSQNESGKVSLNIAKRSNSLVITIDNTKAENINTTQGTGTGLKNTQDRLSLIYGDDAQLITTDNVSSYQIKITLPWEVMV